MKKLITALTIAGLSLASAGTALSQGKVFVYEGPSSKNVEFSYDEKTDTKFVPKSSEKPYFSADQSSDVKFSAEPSKKSFRYNPKNSVRYSTE
jgi:hypothetical protein